MSDTEQATAQIRTILEACSRQFGELLTLDDPEGRLLLAKQLAYRGVRVGPARDVEASEPEEPSLAEVVGGLQAQMDAVWRELRVLNPGLAERPHA